MILVALFSFLAVVGGVAGLLWLGYHRNSSTERTAPAYDRSVYIGTISPGETVIVDTETETFTRHPDHEVTWEDE